MGGWWSAQGAPRRRVLTTARHDHDDDAAMLHRYRTAIHAGVPQAMFDLGREREANGCRDTWELWVRRAALSGHVPAVAMLADVAESRGNSRRDDGYGGVSEASCFRWYWTDLPAACDDPLYREAQQLEAAGEVFEAERSYRRAADGGNAHAAYRLGRLLRRHGSDRADEWLERADREGDAFAAVLRQPRRSWSESYEGREALQRRFVEDLAEAGDLDAAYVIGCQSDEPGWLREAARLGDADAAVVLANRLTGGAARRWMRLAALAGHPAAHINASLWSGELPAARELWQKEASDGDVDATFNLAADAERVGAMDDAERLFRAAAATGDAEAAARLASRPAGSCGGPGGGRGAGP